MKVTIIGTGNMGRAIGTRALAGGHQLTLVGTSLEKAEALATELGSGAAAVEPGGVLEGELVVLAVPFRAVADILERYRSRLEGKVVVDITNPIDYATFELVQPPAGSAAEEIAAGAPGAAVVKAFNTTFASTVVAGSVAGQPLDVLLAGDDREAKERVRRLVEDGGLHAVDAGPLRRARQLEALGILHMQLQETLGTGYASTIKFLS